MNRLAVIGASGHGRVVAEAALRSGWRSVAFFDDAWPELAETGAWQVLGSIQAFSRAHDEFDGTCVAIGDNATRLRVQRDLDATGVHVVTVVHPSAVVSEYARIGSGCVILANAVINPFAQLGKACIVNTAASIDHDCDLADAVHVSPGGRIGGSVRIGEATWVGIGASVRNGVVIGANVTIGAGAAVIGNILAGETVVGVPARPIKAG